MEGAEAGGGGAQNGQPSPCWTFPLEKAEKAAISEVPVGTLVQGQPVGSAILVTASSVGPLGRAPAGVSREIIEALQEVGGGLVGEVVKLLRGTVEVRLCLQ
jgi:hypothetical protein